MPRTSAWVDDLAKVDRLMREVSRQSDPQSLVRTYGRGVRELYANDHWLALSRRGLEFPWFRITRNSRWKEEINPWEQKDKLPLLQGGILGELMHANEPRVIQNLVVAPDDPAAPFLQGVRALVAFPQYDSGEAINVTLALFDDPDRLDLSLVPMMHWQGNLFGRATANLVLRKELGEAYDRLDRELKVVGEIQRSLLPRELPLIPGAELAACYHTSRQAGGDYYDVFVLPDGSCGLFMADVSGHGTPAAVMMAITHAIAHTRPGPPTPPGLMLAYLNDTLARLYTGGTGTFVTAVYGVYDASSRRLTYASAGHPPPRLRRSAVTPLDGVGSLPLGVFEGQVYEQATVQLRSGDVVMMYTDGITEAFNASADMFGDHRLDLAMLNAGGDIRAISEAVWEALAVFGATDPPADDQTMLGIRVL